MANTFFTTESRCYSRLASEGESQKFTGSRLPVAKPLSRAHERAAVQAQALLQPRPAENVGGGKRGGKRSGRRCGSRPGA
jgi:hypothetical protein